ncbi:MAG TPA: type II secretion system F family protein [Nocardioidaceae bacterium]|nr:type II secretion system F family protein [Nocardioidaceae bacterium]
MSDLGALPLALVAAGFAGSATALAVPRRPRPDLAAWLANSDGASRDGAAASQGSERDLLEQHRGLVSLLAGAAPVVLLGGLIGAVSGVVAAAFVHRALGRREPSRLKRRREQVARDLPHVVDLLAVTLAAGAAPSFALRAVLGAVDGPVAADLRAAEHGLELGRDPVRVWREVAQRPGLAPLGRTMARAIESGAPVSESLHRLAEDLHAVARLEAEGRARTVGVRAAAPLGLCLLPAFVLVGVVPLVGSTIGSLLAR